jgi:antitoxin CcdA
MRRPHNDDGGARDPTGRQAVNLSVSTALLREARELRINLSATLEFALASEVRRTKRERWLAANLAGMAAYKQIFGRGP